MADAVGGASGDRTADFDTFVDGLDYPMFVVTTAHGEDRAGCLVGFASQVAIDPPRFMVCLSVNNRTYRTARRAAGLAVHLLSAGQKDLAALFGSHSGDDIDKFGQCRWRLGPAGVPVLIECPRWLYGSVLDQIPLGDHVGFVLDPVTVESTDVASVLTFAQVKDLEAGNPA